MPEMKEEQRQAVFCDEGNVLVSASAGSGKTFVMIERLIRLICEGKAAVNSVLAVTFTEASALDMKEKLKKALEKRIADGGHDFLKSQLAFVPYADICTIHSFCARLVRKYFFAAGASPDFAIADDGAATAIKNECVDKVFRELYSKGEKWFYDLNDRHAVKRFDSNLKSRVIAVSEYCSAEADPDFILEKFKDVYSESGHQAILEELKSRLDEQLKDALAGISAAKNKLQEIGAGKIADTAAAAEAENIRLLSSKDVYVVKTFDPKAFTLRGGNSKEGVAEAKAEFADALEKLKNTVGRIASCLSDEKSDREAVAALKTHTENLVKVVKLYQKEYAERKKEENLLDFSDLEHFALAALKDEVVRKSVSARYKYVFADEYQDVNGVQEEILRLVSDDNLFMVGDVKQSIYGFRGCRPEKFGEKLEKMRNGGEKTILLNYNFRSSDAVIKAVNDVFSFCMTEKYFGFSYAKTSVLRSGGIYPEEAKGRSALHFLSNTEKRSAEKEPPRVYDVLEEGKKIQEKEVPVASLVADIIEKECGEKYYDPKEKKFKNVTYGDVAILTRSRDNAFVADLVSGLIKCGVPVSSEVKENVLDTPEIKMMINALELIDCFPQDTPLASTLKSPIGNFTDEELALIALDFKDDKLNGGFYDAYENYLKKPDAPLYGKLKSFDDYFAKIRKIADFAGAHDIMSRLIGDGRILPYLMATPTGKAKVKRLKRFVAASIVNGKKLTVYEFLNKIKTSPKAFELFDCAEDGTVKVMTMHSSKGLEFPVVIACGTEQTFNSEDERAEIMFDREYGIAVKNYDPAKRTFSETPLRGLLRERILENKVKEEMRLFYVAATRAAYSLHIIFEGKTDTRKNAFSGANCFADYIPASFPCEVAYAEDAEFDEIERTRKVLVGNPDANALARMNKNLSYVYRFSCDTKLPLKSTVTSALNFDRENYYDSHPLFTEDVTDKDRGDTAHLIMEGFDFFSGVSLEEQVKDMIRRGFVTEEAVNKISLDRLNSALSNEVFAKLAGKTLLKEKSFVYGIEAFKIFDTESKEKIVLQGKIDLLATDGKEAFVIDYKYSSLSKETLASKYRKQLDLYSEATENVLKVKVVKKTLVNLFTGETADLM